MLRVTALIAALVLSPVALAKMPPLTDEQKAQAEAARAKAAEGAKKEAEMLSKSQDRVAEKYAAQLKAQGKPFNPTPIAAPAAAPAAAAAPPAAAAAAPPAPGAKP